MDFILPTMIYFEEKIINPLNRNFKPYFRKQRLTKYILYFLYKYSCFLLFLQIEPVAFFLW